MQAARSGWRLARLVLAALLVAATVAAAPGRGARVLERRGALPDMHSAAWRSIWNPQEQVINLAKLHGGLTDTPAQAEQARENRDARNRKASPRSGPEHHLQQLVRDSELPNKEFLLAPENVKTNPFLLIRGNAFASQRPADNPNAVAEKHSVGVGQ